MVEEDTKKSRTITKISLIWNCEVSFITVHKFNCFIKKSHKISPRDYINMSRYEKQRSYIKLLSIADKLIRTGETDGQLINVRDLKSRPRLYCCRSSDL